MSLDFREVLAPFEPPHMDTVTSLAVHNNYLISGSKDKNLRLWAL
jgi:WD40 repeat protein